MEAKATIKYVRLSPMKARRMVDLIRGRQVEEARRILRFAPQSASRTIEKALNSAVANAEQGPGGGGGGPGAKAGGAGSLRQGGQDQKAHLAHHADREVVGRGSLNGSQGQSVRTSAGGHLNGEVPLVRGPRLRGLPARGRVDPQAHP